MLCSPLVLVKDIFSETLKTILVQLSFEDTYYYEEHPTDVSTVDWLVITARR